MQPLLEITDLAVRRGSRIVLSVHQLEVHEGEVLAVIGPNGAGKSTLLLALARLLQPAAGEILFHGQPLSQQGRLEYRRHIGLVLQEPLLLDNTVFNNVAIGLRFRGRPKAEIESQVSRWLERLGIAHLSKRPARSLSGGEAQRVSLARAFALQADLLLLDEPFSALDTPTRMSLLEDFQTLVAETRQTAVFVTHDLEEALMLGDRVAVVLAGELRQVGRTDEVFAAPADPDVAAFVGVETIIPGHVLSCQDGLVRVATDGFQVEAVGETVAGREVYVCLRPEDITIWRGSDVPASSARNRLRGRIMRLVPQGPLVRVVIDCGFPVVSLVTRSSAVEMDLRPGQDVAASFKVSAAHLIPR